MVFPQDQHPNGTYRVAAFQVALLPHLAVDPQLRSAIVGRPGDAVVGPVVGAVVVWQVDILVADPEAHLSVVTFLRNGNQELLLDDVAGVGDDGVDLIHLQQDVHADSEGVQVDRVAELG